MPVQVAAQGDSIHSIAFANGFHPDTLWNHASNKHLADGKRTRATLLPGDEVFVPERTLREESAAAEAAHRYRRKAVPQRFKARFFRFGRPRKDEAYRTVIDRVAGPSGRLDDQGQIDIPVSPGVVEITVTLGNGPSEEVLNFAIGHMDPAHERSGVLARLASLGYRVDETAPDPEAEFGMVLRAFQREQELSPSGELDESTIGRLRDIYEGMADPAKRAGGEGS
jgi:hypothetical protein